MGRGKFGHFCIASRVAAGSAPGTSDVPGGIQVKLPGGSGVRIRDVCSFHWDVGRKVMQVLIPNSVDASEPVPRCPRGLLDCVVLCTIHVWTVKRIRPREGAGKSVSTVPASDTSSLQSFQLGKRRRYATKRAGGQFTRLAFSASPTQIPPLSTPVPAHTLHSNRDSLTACMFPGVTYNHTPFGSLSTKN